MRVLWLGDAIMIVLENGSTTTPKSHKQLK